jgi:hypothetical protein
VNKIRISAIVQQLAAGAAAGRWDLAAIARDLGGTLAL